jgi:hypothetical protein
MAGKISVSLGAMRMRRGTDQPAADRSTRQKACLTLFIGPASCALQLIFWNTAVIGFVENVLSSPSVEPCVTQRTFIQVAMEQCKGR